MTTPLGTYTTKTPQQIHDDVLRTIKNGLIKLGVSNPNVGPSSDYDITATALANELAVVLANNTILADAHVPDTAAGSDLDRWLNVFNLSRRPAIGSSGLITITCSTTSTLIATGSQLLNPANGLRYQVTVGGTYNNASTVPVAAIDGGNATNLINGYTLNWVTAPPFCSPTVTVGTVGGSDGLAGGADSEVGVDEPPRARLFAALQTPRKPGNSSDIAAWASASTPVVQAGFVYPALLGPGTVFFAVTAAAQGVAPFTSTSKNRDVPMATVTGTVVPYVLGLIPEYAYAIGSTVTNQPTDVAILLSLPAAQTASPPGPGGGWLDGTPWPPSISGTTPVTVTAVTSSTVFTVNATVTPQAGISHISVLSATNWTLYSATVLSVTGSSGAYVITVDTPIPPIANGDYVWPSAQNGQTYVNALLGAFALMGPGEWTSNATSLIRGFRHPLPSLTWPSQLLAQQLKAVINAGPEVLDASYIFRSSTAPTIPSGGIPTTQAGVNAATQPAILTPRHLSFYAK